MKEKIKTIGKRIVKIRLFISIATTAFTVATTVYSLIPKADKIEVIDTEALVAQNAIKEADKASETVEA